MPCAPVGGRCAPAVIYPVAADIGPVTEKGKAAWFLALLSPIMAEVLSGSSPPAEFFLGLGFLLLIPLYGGGALLVRELAVRWDKGWATVITLGAAYGIVEEGIAVKSFFDPNWVDLGDLGVYGRFLEVNWVWSVWLTVYHSMISITLPILMLSIWYPHLRREPILTPRQFKLVGWLFAIDVVFCVFLFVAGQDYVPPLFQYAACFVVVYLLYRLAKAIPKDLVSARHHAPSWRPAKFLALGFAMMLAGMVFGMSSWDDLHPAVPILMLLLACAGTLLLLQHKMGAAGNSVHKAFFAVGLILLLMMAAPFHELNSGMVGMTATAVAFAVFSALLIRKARSHERDANARA